METINACRVCASKKINKFFDLGKQPLANSLLDSSTQKEDLYSLSLSYCEDCSLVQLNETVEPEKLFSHYVWVTGTSKVAHEHAEYFCKQLVAHTEQARDNYVLEIASNDGTFLIPFKREGFKVLGIDPAENIAAMAREQGIPTDAVFFGASAAKKIVAEHGPAQMVFARNVLPHVANTRDFVEGLATCLAEDGTLAIEAHSARIIQEELHYDSIYHEHLCYFTFKSLERLLNDFGLHVFDIAKSPISGGSLIVYAKKHMVEPSTTVVEYRKDELRDKINEFPNWKAFADRAFAHREKLLAMLAGQKGQKRKIAGWGASARSSTLLNFCNITTEGLPVIIDMNPLKQGKYTAGTHIPIKKAKDVMTGSPDCVFILGWNFKDEIVGILRNQFGFKGACLLPFPGDPHVLDLS